MVNRRSSTSQSIATIVLKSLVDRALLGGKGRRIESDFGWRRQVAMQRLQIFVADCQDSNRVDVCP